MGETGLEDPEKEHALPYSLPVVEEWSDPPDRVNLLFILVAAKTLHSAQGLVLCRVGEPTCGPGDCVYSVFPCVT